MDETPPKKKESKISLPTALLMVGLAALYELINFGLTFIPVVGDPIGTFLVGAMIDLNFWMWFTWLGVSYTKNPSRAIVFFVSMFGNLLPVIQEFATIGVLYTILSVWTEEKLEQHPIVAAVGKKALSSKRFVDKIGGPISKP